MSGNDVCSRKLDFDTKVYPVEAVLGAAYKYLDEVYTRVESSNGDKSVVATLKAKKAQNAEEWENFISEFEEEVLSQSLRIKILKSTKKVRDQIITIALAYTPYTRPVPSAGAGQDACGCGDRDKDTEIDKELESILAELKSNIDDDNYEEDPLDIAVPWEEKYESDSNKGTDK